ncbi:MAG: hypothetical protein JSS32_05390 [Verrucomicrobia bacterium]|nr:hypothetical protein [Verrucomicrobiota bacterium]
MPRSVDSSPFVLVSAPPSPQSARSVSSFVLVDEKVRQAYQGTVPESAEKVFRALETAMKNNQEITPLLDAVDFSTFIPLPQPKGTLWALGFIHQYPDAMEKAGDLDEDELARAISLIRLDSLTNEDTEKRVADAFSALIKIPQLSYRNLETIFEHSCLFHPDFLRQIGNHPLAQKLPWQTYYQQGPSAFLIGE